MLAAFAVRVALGIGALLVFVNALLRPDAFATLGLPLVAIAAGVAATFSPCVLPALPGLLAEMTGEGHFSRVTRQTRLRMSSGRWCTR